MKKTLNWKRLLTAFVALCFMVPWLTAPAAAVQQITVTDEILESVPAAPFGTLVREFSVSGGTARVYEDSQLCNGGVLHMRGWTLRDGDLCVMGSLQTDGATPSEQALWTVDTGHNVLTIRYHDGTQWYVDNLKEGIYPSATAFFLSGEDYSMLCYTPQSWKLLENGSRKLLTEQQGWLRTEKTSSGWRISLCVPALNEGCVSDFLCLTSKTELVNWEKPNTENLWSNYCNNGSGRWCYDGYYFEAPSTYVPSGENVYYWLPAAYLVNSFAHQSKAARGAEDLAVCMMDVLLLGQTEQGFFPTKSYSQWLSSSYGIGAGFYDTRFNSDLMEIIVYLWNYHRSDVYRAAMERYCQFYLAFAENFHMDTASGGWLIPDYWSQDMAAIPHTSLNHQLAETKVLYEMAAILERDDLTALADNMLLAVQDTGMNWVRTDGDLHYSISRAGEYGGTDYPYLTYNDLFHMQDLLEKRKGEQDPTLAAMMARKKQWMDTNGVTGYLE